MHTIGWMLFGLGAIIGLAALYTWAGNQIDRARERKFRTEWDTALTYINNAPHKEWDGQEYDWPDSWPEGELTNYFFGDTPYDPEAETTAFLERMESDTTAFIARLREG